jgi:hypothetical protein
VKALDAIRRALDGRPVIWFGIRGEDAASLLRLPEFKASYAITAPVQTATIPEDANVTIENLSGERVDLDQYEPDLDDSTEMQEFRRRLLREVSGRCVVMTYRPAAFVSALAFAMSDTMTLAGLFRDRQSAFEHKPWVETSLEARGVRTLGWKYIADDHRTRAARLLDQGPIVLRASRSSGGVGITRVDSHEGIDRSWPDQIDAFVGVTRYLGDAIPLNVSGCVFADGEVRLHPPSLQLIGIAGCTNRGFGYCGNDFGAVGTLDAHLLEALDTLVRRVAAWLHHERYVGAFGVDALIHEDKVLFTEVNPRFQGSSALSAVVAADLELPDLFLDHLAATLGLGPVDVGLSLLEWARRQPPVSHVVVHNVSGDVLVRREDAPLPSFARGIRIAQLPARNLAVHDGGVLSRIVLDRSVTSTGFEIDAAAGGLVASLSDMFMRHRTILSAEGRTDAGGT